MTKYVLAVLLSLFLISGNSAKANDRDDATERVRMATDVLSSIMNTPDKGVPEEVLEDAKCIMVIPHLVKAAFIFGGKHGRGLATCRTANGWSAPAFVSATGGSWGLQIGAEAVDLVLLVMNDLGMQHLLSSKFQIGGEGSAAAGPVGRHASAGTDWKLNTEILTYSRTKGIFAGISLDGTVIQQDDDATRAIYRSMIPFRRLLSGSVPPPPATAEFMTAVKAASRQARVAEANEQKK